MASFDAENLTVSELRSKLAEYGYPIGPATEITREILIKKLVLMKEKLMKYSDFNEQMLMNLMGQKNSPRSANRSQYAFSSGDESGSDTDQNGGSRKRRVAMPPPSGYKTRRGKTSFPTYTPEVSPVPSISKVSCSTPLQTSRVTADLKAPRFSSPAFSLKPPQYTATSRAAASSTYDFDSGSDSDLPDFKHLPSTTKRRTGLTYGSLSSYRSKLNNVNSRGFFGTPTDTLGIRNYSKKDSKPFLSSFVGRFSRKNNAYETVNPLDIKESDVEEDGFAEKWRNVNFAARNFNFRDWIKPLKSVFQHFKSKDSTINSWNSSQLLSMLLLGLFVLFFIWLALAYFRVSQKAGIGGKSGHHYPICHSQEELPEKLCIQKDNLSYAIHLYKDVHLELQARGLRHLCGPALEDGSTQKPYMAESEILDFLLQSRRTNETIKVIHGIKNLKLLVLANRHWGISLLKDSPEFIESNFDRLAYGYALSDKAVLPKEIPSYLKEDARMFFVCRTLSIPWTCYISKLFYKLLFTLVLIGCGILGLGLLRVAYLFLKSYQKVKQTENEAVMEMVQKIVEHVSEVAERAANSGVDSNGSVSSVPQDYVAVRHVHDTLIHPAKRQEKARIWQKAVKFIEENESRIRTEVQQVWGEDTTVWRWVGPTLNKTANQWPSSSPVSSDSGVESNHLYPDLSSLKTEVKKNSDRVWQGEAFETSAGSMNSLPSSPTQCLKIRHMFKHDKDYGPNWIQKVRDAIVEKCEGAKILHLSVDKHSKEGCVYVKCASLQDAGLAYRQLHGSWFDGALVTVKYVRLERYHERFPDSVYARTPLRPSNNLRLSLQGTSSS